MTIFDGNFVDRFFERLTGAMNFRFAVQPLTAIALGIRDGILDAKAGTPPFIYNVIFKPENRKEHLKSALNSLLKPIIIGIILDAIAQYLIFEHVRILGAVFMGTCIMGIPYALARGLTNRFVSLRKK